MNDPAKFAGTYWREFRNHTGMEKFFELLDGRSATLQVDVDDRGTLRINGKAGYGEISPGVLWNAQGEPALDQSFSNSGLWAFARDTSDDAQYASPTFAIDTYARVDALANPRFAMTVLSICGLLAVTGLLSAFWPLGAGRARLAKWLPPIIVAALAAFALVMLAGYPEGDGLVTALLLGKGGRLLSMVLLANLTALAAFVMCIVTILAWRYNYWGAGGRATARRVHFTILTGAALGLTWVFGFANLLGLKLP